jgi:hypothetical protein
MAAAPDSDNLAYRRQLVLEASGFSPGEARNVTKLEEHIVRTRKRQHRRALQAGGASEPSSTGAQTRDASNTDKADTGPKGATP